MLQCKDLLSRYWKEQDAAEDIQQVLFTIMAFSLAAAVGWWIFNALKKQTAAEDCSQSDSPFCIG